MIGDLKYAQYRDFSLSKSIYSTPVDIIDPFFFLFEGSKCCSLCSVLWRVGFHRQSKRWQCGWCRWVVLRPLTAFYSLLPRKRACWVSECNNWIRALNELCRFRSDIPRSLKLLRRRSFLQSILQKCCLVTSSGPAWLNTIFSVITSAVSYMQL